MREENAVFEMCQWEKNVIKFSFLYILFKKLNIYLYKLNMGIS